MFGVNWADPQTLWLNLTNLGLGIVVLVCLGVVGYGVIRDLFARKSAVTQGQVDRVVDRMLGQVESPHAFHAPDLGWTMADGGEPEQQPEQQPKRQRRAAAKGKK